VDGLVLRNGDNVDTNSFWGGHIQVALAHLPGTPRQIVGVEGKKL
jgi:hypothetical protein